MRFQANRDCNFTTLYSMQPFQGWWRPVHSNLVQSCQYALLKTTSQHPGRNDVTWICCAAGTSTRLDWIQIFLLVYKFVDKKFGWSRAGPGGPDPPTDPRLVFWNLWLCLACRVYSPIWIPGLQSVPRKEARVTHHTWWCLHELNACAVTMMTFCE
jgi:hypothetical protein